MANPIPTITFQVDLSTTSGIAFMNQNLSSADPANGLVNITPLYLNQEYAFEKRVLLPGLLPGNMYEVQHGGQITESGAKAIYLLNTYGPNSNNPILTIVSTSDVQS